jgi:hypothetical protein
MEGYIILLQSIALPSELRPDKAPTCIRNRVVGFTSMLFKVQSDDHYTMRAWVEEGFISPLH